MPSRLHRHDEPGHIHFLTFSCFRRLQFFRHPTVRDAFVSSMKEVRERLSIRWLGYVVIPEHAHLVVVPQQQGSAEIVPIPLVLQLLKRLGGKACKNALRNIWANRGTLGTRALDLWATVQGEKPFWKPRGYDFNVFNESKRPRN